MPGLVPGIHVLAAYKQEDVDAGTKPGHDEKGIMLKFDLKTPMHFHPIV